jgi:hypothetical protein
LTKQEIECYEMFALFDTGAHDLILKTNIKQWEYILYNGRPELYPQDRKAIFSLLKLKNQKAQAEQKKKDALAAMKSAKGLGLPR